jgi:hypothetical protein
VLVLVLVLVPVLVLVLTLWAWVCSDAARERRAAERTNSRSR